MTTADGVIDPHCRPKTIKYRVDISSCRVLVFGLVPSVEIRKSGFLDMNVDQEIICKSTRCR